MPADTAALLISEPVWSPDGTKIAFVESPEGTAPTASSSNGSRIMVINADGTDEHAVSQPPPLQPDGTWTCDGPDGSTGGVSWEYFTDDDPSWSADGPDVHYVRYGTPSPANGADQESPGLCLVDGGTIIYSASPTQTLRAVPASGGDGTDLGPLLGPGVSQLVAWSPDGEHYITEEAWGSDNPRSGVYEVDGRTGADTQLVQTDGFQMRGADYSPDGTEAAFSLNGQPGSGPSVVFINFTDDVRYTYTDLDQPADGSVGGVRFSPDGNGLIYQTGASLVERMLPDPDGDVRPGEPQVKILGPAPPEGSLISLSGNLDFDVQAQQLPIIFAPGLMGSELTCNGRVIWPPSLMNPRPDLDLLRLTPRGANANCPTATGGDATCGGGWASATKAGPDSAA